MKINKTISMPIEVINKALKKSKKKKLTFSGYLSKLIEADNVKGLRD